MLNEYAQLDATALAELVRKREVSASELLETAIQRAQQVNPELNAIVIEMHEIARQRVGEALTGPFAGVPFLIKDIAQDYAGVVSSAGSRALRNWKPESHAEIVNRFLAAGLVIFGKTNTPEFALKGTTEPEFWGATRNPWNPAHTTGGSSGGSAAAVAAGIVPMAGASDGGGSIRIPAACCGLFGLRPSRGRVPIGPRHAEFWEGASSEGVVSRSVRDTASMLDALQGPDIGAPFVIKPPETSYAKAIQSIPKGLRIGYSTRSPIGTPVDAECAEAVTKTAARLEALGHHVEEAAPDYDGQALADCFIRMYCGQTAASIENTKALTGARDSDFEIDTRALALLGRAMRSDEYIRSHQKWNTFSRQVGQFFTQYDLYLTPTLAQPPAKIGEQNTPAWQQQLLKPLLALDMGRALLRSGLVDQMATEALRRVPFTQLANLTGTPAMSVPLDMSSGGLPLGVHFQAACGREDVLLQLAAQLEAAHPWADRYPPELALLGSSKASSMGWK